MPSSISAGRRTSRAAGFSLAEVLVSLSAFIAILVGVLFLFNLNYRLARGRGDAAERRESLRLAEAEIVRLARAASRGGLPPELAIEVARDVPAGHRIGGPDSPPVVAGSDVLTVRGVFSTPLLRAGPTDGSLRLERAAGSPAGVVEVRDPSPQTGARQSLAELAAALPAAGRGGAALLVVSQLDESVFAVVTADLESASVAWDGGRPSRVTLPFLAGDTPPLLAGAGAATALGGGALVGLLEEYRFYVRAARAAPGDESSAPRPRLSVARFEPGTDEPWRGDPAELAVDLADGVVDLRIAGGTGPGDGLEVSVELVAGPPNGGTGDSRPDPTPPPAAAPSDS